MYTAPNSAAAANTAGSTPGSRANVAVAAASRSIPSNHTRAGPVRATRSPVNAPATPATPSTIHIAVEAVAPTPAATTRSRPKTHTAALPTPSAAAASRSRPAPGRHHGPRVSSPDGRRARPPGTVAATHTVTSTAIAQKAAHARRQLPDSTSAIGPDTATPTPVPALTTVWTRSARSAGTHRATASASGGEARPVLDPATTTPTARTGTFGRSEEHT